MSPLLTTVKCGNISEDGQLKFWANNFVSSNVIKSFGDTKNEFTLYNDIGDSDLHYKGGLTLSNTQYWYRRTA